MNDQLPPNWNTLTEDERNANSIERYLHDKFPGLTFIVTPELIFKVRVEQEGVDLPAIQAAVAEWFRMAYGNESHVEWGAPVHVDTAPIGESRVRCLRCNESFECNHDNVFGFLFGIPLYMCGTCQRLRHFDHAV